MATTSTSLTSTAGADLAALRAEIQLLLDAPVKIAEAKQDLAKKRKKEQAEAVLNFARAAAAGPLDPVRALADYEAAKAKDDATRKQDEALDLFVKMIYARLEDLKRDCCEEFLAIVRLKLTELQNLLAEQKKKAESTDQLIRQLEEVRTQLETYCGVAAPPPPAKEPAPPTPSRKEAAKP